MNPEIRRRRALQLAIEFVWKHNVQSPPKTTLAVASLFESFIAKGYDEKLIARIIEEDMDNKA